MIKIRALFLVLLGLLLVKNTWAQNEFLTDNTETDQKLIRVNAGTQGIGAEFSYGIFTKTALRLGANYIPVSSNNAFEISGFNSTSRLKATFSNVHLLADYTPFENASGFRLVGGGAYFLNANGNVLVEPSGNYTYGDIVLDPNQAGKLNLNVNWKGFAPYLGIGLLKAFPGSVFNINFDIGTYYLKKPQGLITGTGILDGNSSQTTQFQQNISNYRFLPLVQLNFNFKI